VKIALLVLWPAGVTILTGPVTAPAGTTAVIKPLAFTVNSAVVVVQPVAAQGQRPERTRTLHGAAALLVDTGAGGIIAALVRGGEKAAIRRLDQLILWPRAFPASSVAASRVPANWTAGISRSAPGL
jgi:hypothetical protein